MVAIISILGAISIILFSYLYYLNESKKSQKLDAIADTKKLAEAKSRRNVGMVICGIVLVLVVLLIPVAIYVDNLGTSSLSKTLADWGSFGDYVGGILNPVISLFTLALTLIIALTLQERERRLKAQELKKNAQPELVTDLEKVFYGDSTNPVGVPYPAFFSYQNPERTKPENLPHYTPFAISVYNIGQRTAKNLVFTFAIDFDSAIETLKALNEKNSHQCKIEYSEVPNKSLYGLLEVGFPTGSEERILLIKENRHVISHIVNADISNQPYQLPIPSEFLELYKAFVFLYYWSDKEIKEIKFPVIDLSVDFQDIYGHSYKASFQIKLDYWMGYENTIHQIKIINK